MNTIGDLDIKHNYTMYTFNFRSLSDADMQHIPNAYPNRMMGIGAYLGDNLIGWGLLTCWRDVGEISDLWVDEKHRNQGIGTQLIAHLAKMAYHRQITTLEIGVDGDNVSARRLYERLGFVFHRTINHTIYLRCQTQDMMQK